MSARGTCLVTGAAGFVGRVLCAQLTGEGCTVRALLRREASGPWAAAWRVDLSRETPPDEALSGVDVVFHLAARTHAVDDAAGADTAYERLNVAGTQRLVTAAARAGVRRVVMFSSVKAMGEGGPLRLDETAPCAPTTVYGRTKLAAERIVLGVADEGGPEGVVLRLPLVYGPGVKGNLARMLDTVSSGRFPSLPEAGARSLVHVEDVARAALAAAALPAAAGRVYLLTDGEDYSSRRLYELMSQATGRVPATWRLPRALLVAAARAGDVFGRVTGRRAPMDSAALEKLLGSALYDDGRARRELAYAPRHTVAEALPAMLAARRPPDAESGSHEDQAEHAQR